MEDQEVKLYLDELTDCFSGADGGVTFINLRELLKGYAQQAREGDPAAQRLLEIFRQFSNLVYIAKNM
jgi:hypothetical protein